MAERYNLDVILRAKSEGMATFKEAETALGGIAKAGLVVGAVLAGAVVVGAAQAVRAAGAFQLQMTQLVTGAGEAEKNLGFVTAGLLKMAGDTGTSATELAKGMFMIESAGFHGAAGLKVLESAAQGAKVGNASLAVTADAVTTVLKDYHLSANQAADATNFLVSVVSQGKTHMEDLALALSAILPTASALHVPLAQIGGAMATLTARGVPAADAATYLRFTLSALAGPSGKGVDAMKSIGLTAKQVGDSLTREGLLPALELIQSHLSKKFPQGGAQMFATLKEITGGTRGLGAALGLTGDNLASFEAATKSVAAQIAAGKGAVIGWDLTQADFNTQMDKAKFAIEAAGIKIGMILLPYAQRLLQALVPMIPVVADFASKMATQLMPQIISFATWLKSLGPDLQKGYDIFKAWAPFILGVAAAWAIWNIALAITAGWQAIIAGGQFVLGLIQIVRTVGLATAAQWLFNIALTANPIGVIIIAIAALAAGVIWAYQNVGWFRDAVNTLGGAFKAFATQFWADIKPIFDWIGGTLIPLIKEAVGWLGQIGATSPPSAAAGHISGGGRFGRPIGAAGGFEGTVYRPTLFLAGEGGAPEHVSIGSGGRSTIVNHFHFEGGFYSDGPALDRLTMAIAQRLSFTTGR